MRFVRPVTRRIAALGAVTGALIVAGVVGGGGPARASTLAVTAAPIVGSASATLSQVNAGEWTTTVYLDTAALCAGENPAGNTFSLVTGRPNSVTSADAPAYPDGPLACGAAAANLYYAQPLLPRISRDLHVGSGTAALVITAAQIGYGIGLALIVPVVIEGSKWLRRRRLPAPGTIDVESAVIGSSKGVAA